jgi:hypothetical protein
METKTYNYRTENPPIWDCIKFKNCVLVQEHLDRLLQVRELREQKDPSGCLALEAKELKMLSKEAKQI